MYNKKGFLFSVLFLKLFIALDAFAIDESSQACSLANSEVCPNLVILERVFNLKKDELENKSLASLIRVKITNTARIPVTVQLASNFNSNTALCGSSFTLQGLSFTIADLNCDVGGFPYRLYDIDGRSNVLTIDGVNVEDCTGKPIGAECRGGYIFKLSPDGKIVSKVDVPAVELQWSQALSVCNEYSVLSKGVFYNNWYLPSSTELGDLHSVRASIPTTFQINDYWSSTEVPASANVFVWDFTEPPPVSNPGQSAKTEINFARCIQSF